MQSIKGELNETIKSIKIVDKMIKETKELLNELEGPYDMNFEALMRATELPRNRQKELIEGIESKLSEYAHKIMNQEGNVKMLREIRSNLEKQKKNLEDIQNAALILVEMKKGHI
jgi:DNA repair exonuclease SbcCD nuclease subunit